MPLAMMIAGRLTGGAAEPIVVTTARMAAILTFGMPQTRRMTAATRPVLRIAAVPDAGDHAREEEQQHHQHEDDWPRCFRNLLRMS